MLANLATGLCNTLVSKLASLLVNLVTGLHNIRFSRMLYVKRVKLTIYSLTLASMPANLATGLFYIIVYYFVCTVQ